MKKIKLVLMLVVFSGILTTISCSKDKEKETAPVPTPPTTGGTPIVCNCGVVVSKNPATIKVTLQNTCSNNTQDFVVAYSVMDNANNGDTICMATGTSW